MITTRWRKVWRDLATNKVRTALVVVAIAIGVMTIGAVAGARSIVLRSLAASEATVNSASATLLVSSFDDALVETVRGTPGVSDAEGRRSLDVRVATAGDQAKTLELFVVPDYRQIRIDRIQPESGAWPPPPDTMLLERASLKYLGWTIGDVASIETPDGTRRKLPIEGTVHDLSQPASTITGVVYGYISFETLEGLGESSELNELHIKVTGHGNDRQYIQSIASTVRNQVEDSGHTVISMSVPEPGRFWAQDYMESLLALLEILGGVCLFLSGFLVVNTVSALMAQQVRQIGVMKAVGADLRQIAGKKGPSSRRGPPPNESSKRTDDESREQENSDPKRARPDHDRVCTRATGPGSLAIDPGWQSDHGSRSNCKLWFGWRSVRRCHSRSPAATSGAASGAAVTSNASVAAEYGSAQRTTCADPGYADSGRGDLYRRVERASIADPNHRRYLPIYEF